MLIKRYYYFWNESVTNFANLFKRLLRQRRCKFYQIINIYYKLLGYVWNLTDDKYRIEQLAHHVVGHRENFIRWLCLMFVEGFSGRWCQPLLNCYFASRSVFRKRSTDHVRFDQFSISFNSFITVYRVYHDWMTLKQRNVRMV